MNLDLLKEHLELVNGQLVWRTNNKRRRAGELAGGAVGNAGYRAVQVCGERYLVHRAVWALHNGRVPDGVVDHIDRDTGNNHPDNLRLASRGENNANARMSSLNTTGVKGLTYDKTAKCWQGVIKLGSVKMKKRSVHKQIVIDWLNQTRGEVHGEFAHDGR